jgi:hypothetical protein
MQITTVLKYYLILRETADRYSVVQKADHFSDSQITLIMFKLKQISHILFRLY